MIQSIDRRFIKYVLVGILNTTFSYSLYSIFLYIGIKYQIANLLALAFGIIFSFTTQGTIVFNNATKITFIKFVLAWISIYSLNITLIGLLIRAPMSPYLAGAIAIFPVTFLSYFILKVIVFKKWG